MFHNWRVLSFCPPFTRRSTFTEASPVFIALLHHRWRYMAPPVAIKWVLSKNIRVGECVITWSSSYLFRRKRSKCFSRTQARGRCTSGQGEQRVRIMPMSWNITNLHYAELTKSSSISLELQDWKSHVKNTSTNRQEWSMLEKIYTRSSMHREGMLLKRLCSLELGEIWKESSIVAASRWYWRWPDTLNVRNHLRGLNLQLTVYRVVFVVQRYYLPDHSRQ